MTEPEPSFTKTYKLADGKNIGDHRWVSSLDHFEEYDEPVELIEETWDRTAVRTYWHLPMELYDCGRPGCDEDAVGWWFSDADHCWVQVCADHDDGTAARP